MNNVIEIESNVKERLKKIIAKELEIESESIVDEEHIVNDLGMDSVDMICILFEIEDEFKIEISDEEVGEISTIETMYNLISMKILQVDDYVLKSTG